jgi:hypothetical protein
MRILIRTSKWAIWARRFGSFAVPLAIIPIFLHREKIITTTDFHTIELVAMAIAVLAFGLALGAFGRLWITGDQGWARATMGLFFSLVCLAPLAFILSLTLRFPAVADVSTDQAQPLTLVSAIGRVQTPADRAAVEAAFPNARGRSYPIEAMQMFTIVEQLAAARGWEQLVRRAPQTVLDHGELNLIATTLLGWRDEVAIRVEGNPQGSTVDMRSASTHAWHDLGENGRRIEEFLLALDTRITLMLRDAPIPAAAPESDTGETPKVTQEE